LACPEGAIDVQLVCKQQNAPLTQQTREAIADSASMLSRQAGVVAAGANDIGSSGLNDFTKKLAHAALGCAGGGAMAGNSSGCSAGAVGAVVGEMAAEYYMGNQLDASKTFEQNVQAAKTFAKVVAAASGVIAGGGGDNVAAVNVANNTGANAVENNYFSRSPFAGVRTAVAKENARLTAQCGTTCTAADFQRIDQQGAKLEQTLNLVEMAQRGKLNAKDATNLTQLIIEVAPGTGTLESLAQLITGKQSLTGEETSRLWAAVGVVPFGGVLKPLGRKVGDLATVLAKEVGKAETVAVDAAKVADNAAKSPVDIAHTIGANSAQNVVELTFDKGTRTWTTPAGVDYGPGSVHGNRVQQVLDHAVPNPNKATHTVFNVDRREVLGLVDDAWLAKGNPLPNDPGAYVVQMGRVIGTAGETSIKIIIRPGTNKIITAYPIQ